MSAPGARILAYHRVSPAHDELAVRPRTFREQMEALVEAQVEIVPLQDVLRLLGERPLGQYVCVTFDDGYHDNLDQAIPVLRDLRIPATLFVASSVIDGSAPLYWWGEQPELLTWAELQEIARDDLFTVGAHSRTHPALPQLSDELAWQEIAGAKGDIEAKIGQSVCAFAYPAGLYGEREVRMVQDAGYQLAVTVEPGLNPPGHDARMLRRMVIDHRDNVSMFEAKFTGLLDHPWGLRDMLGAAGRLYRGRNCGA
jgi:peptidoglycan/xylan/chitin deacetylase (PgdA/CDA1 family)